MNNIAFPSLVAPSYAPPGRHYPAVVLGDEDLYRDNLVDLVRDQCAGWFGAGVDQWEHIKTRTIHHALPHQSPSTSNPYIVGALLPGNNDLWGIHQSAGIAVGDHVR